MTKSAKQPKPQSKKRFSLDHDGLTEFLVEFQIIWAALKALYSGPFGDNDQTRNFVRRMENMARHASVLLEDGENDFSTYERTIKLGLALMNQIEEFVEEVIEFDRVNEFFDHASTEIEKVWPETWAAKMNGILEARARFQQVSTSKDVEDLKKIVLAYNEATSLVNKAKAEAQTKANAEAERLLEAQQAKERLARMEKNRSRGRSVLAQLTA